MSDNILPKWLKVDKKRFNSIKNKVQNAKENNLQARPSGKLIDFTMSNKLIRDIVKLLMKKHWKESS